MFRFSGIKGALITLTTALPHPSKSTQLSSEIISDSGQIATVTVVAFHLKKRLTIVICSEETVAIDCITFVNRVC